MCFVLVSLSGTVSSGQGAEPRGLDVTTGAPGPPHIEEASPREGRRNSREIHLPLSSLLRFCIKQNQGPFFSKNNRGAF